MGVDGLMCALRSTLTLYCLATGGAAELVWRGGGVSAERVWTESGRSRLHRALHLNTNTREETLCFTHGPAFTDGARISPSFNEVISINILGKTHYWCAS